jgi:protein-tyrosine phosphatase
VIRVCFVCFGNICRSPTAEGIFRQLVEQAGLEREIGVESAGTSGYHTGDPPDDRSLATAAARGVPLVSRGRKLDARDLMRLDYVLVMDGENLEAIQQLAGGHASPARVMKLLVFHPELPDESDVLDPYEGGPSGFDDVFDLCEAACRGLLDHIKSAHGLEARARS